jgi:hypothetical protein
MKKTLYAILGLENDASVDVIAKAHERLLAETDPNDAMRLMALNEAWSILGDPTRRARYDDMLTSVLPDEKIMVYDSLAPRGFGRWPQILALGVVVLGAFWYVQHGSYGTEFELPPTAAGPASDVQPITNPAVEATGKDGVATLASVPTVAESAPATSADREPAGSGAESNSSANIP